MDRFDDFNDRYITSSFLKQEVDDYRSLCIIYVVTRPIQYPLWIYLFLVEEAREIGRWAQDSLRIIQIIDRL
jgi:hypothetical protein